MASNLVNFKVADSRGVSGVNAPSALLQYGKQMLSLSEIYPYFGNDARSKENAGILGRIVPVWTKTHVVLSKRPLIETIQKIDGKHFLLDESHQNFDQPVWYCQIPSIFLENPAIMGLKSVFFTFETGYEIKEIGRNKYLTTITDSSAVRISSIPEEGWAQTKELPFLFGKEIENLRVSLQLPGYENVKVGIVSAGNVVFDGFDGMGDNVPKEVVIPDWAGDLRNVLIREDISK